MSPRWIWVLLPVSAFLFIGCGNDDDPTSTAEPLVPCSYADTVGTNFAVDEPAEVTRTVPAVYPDIAREQGAEGTVYTELTVGRSGFGCNAVVSSSNTTAELEQAALDAVVQWEFKPATRNGTSAPTRLLIPFRFNLN